MDVSHLNAIVLVFGMPGCPACDEFIPRLCTRARALQKTHGTIVYDKENQPSSTKKVKKGTLPIFVYDVNSNDPSLQALADQYKIQAMPTTIVLVRPQGAMRVEGSVSDGQIDYILGEAVKHI